MAGRDTGLGRVASSCGAAYRSPPAVRPALALQSVASAVPRLRLPTCSTVSPGSHCARLFVPTTSGETWLVSTARPSLPQEVPQEDDFQLLQRKPLKFYTVGLSFAKAVWVEGESNQTKLPASSKLNCSAQILGARADRSQDRGFCKSRGTLCPVRQCDGQFPVMGNRDADRPPRQSSREPISQDQVGCCDPSSC